MIDPIPPPLTLIRAESERAIKSTSCRRRGTGRITWKALEIGQKQIPNAAPATLAIDDEFQCVLGTPVPVYTQKPWCGSWERL